MESPRRKAKGIIIHSKGITAIEPATDDLVTIIVHGPTQIQNISVPSQMSFGGGSAMTTRIDPNIVIKYS